jgi:hypothetical protein
MRVFCLIHLLAEVDFPPFIDDFHLETKVTSNQKTFISILACSPHFSFGGPSSMVYELLQNYFVPNDSMSGFNLFFEIYGHIARGLFHFYYCVYFYISIPSVGKEVYRHTSHCN